VKITTDLLAPTFTVQQNAGFDHDANQAGQTVTLRVQSHMQIYRSEGLKHLLGDIPSTQCSVAPAEPMSWEAAKWLLAVDVSVRGLSPLDCYTLESFIDAIERVPSPILLKPQKLFIYENFLPELVTTPSKDVDLTKIKGPFDSMHAPQSRAQRSNSSHCDSSRQTSLRGTVDYCSLSTLACFQRRLDAK
jgi:hypothetical protein